MNRSKSTKIFYNPAHLEYFNCQDNQTKDHSYERYHTFYDNHQVNVDWVRLMEDKDKERKKKKINYGRGYINGAQGRQRAGGYDHATGFVGFKQQITDYPIECQVDQRHYINNSPFHPTPQTWPCSTKPDLLSNLTNYSQTLTTQQQSTQEQQPKTNYYAHSHNDHKNGQDHAHDHRHKSQSKKNQLKQKVINIENGILNLKQQKQLYQIKMLEYQMKIDRLNCQIQRKKEGKIDGGKKDSRGRGNKGHNQSYGSVETRGADKDDELEGLRQSLLEQIQAKNLVIEQRDMLMTQLSQTLQTHQTQLTTLTSQLTHTKSTLTKSTLALQQTIAQLSSLKQLYKTQQTSLSNLNQQNKELQIKLSELQLINDNLQALTIRLNTQNIQINQEMDILMQRMENMKMEEEDGEKVREEFQRIVREQRWEIQGLRGEVSGWEGKWEIGVVEFQEVKKQMYDHENSLQQWEKMYQQQSQQVQKLKITIQQLSSKLHQAKKQPEQSPQPQPQSQTLTQILTILSLPPTTSPQTLFHTVNNILNYNNLITQTLYDYQQILEMFGIDQNKQENCHQKLLTEIGQFRSNMKNLVKKIRNLEHKISGLLQENKKLVGIVKNGVGDGVKQLEKLVVEQNQEIVRYRMCMANFSILTNARKDI